MSVWSSDWSQDVCHLLDWLSFPGPPTAPNGSRLRKGDKVRGTFLYIAYTWQSKANVFIGSPIIAECFIKMIPILSK